jgi:hypothetical protein
MPSGTDARSASSQPIRLEFLGAPFTGLVEGLLGQRLEPIGGRAKRLLLAPL